MSDGYKIVDCEEVLKRLQADIQVKTSVLEYYIALSAVIYRNLYERLKKNKVDETIIQDVLYTAWRSKIDEILQEIFDDADTIARVLAYRLYNASVCYQGPDGVYVAYDSDKVLEVINKKKNQ